MAVAARGRARAGRGGNAPPEGSDMLAPPPAHTHCAQGAAGLGGGDHHWPGGPAARQQQVHARDVWADLHAPAPARRQATGTCWGLLVRPVGRRRCDAGLHEGGVTLKRRKGGGVGSTQPGPRAAEPFRPTRTSGGRPEPQARRLCGGCNAGAVPGGAHAQRGAAGAGGQAVARQPGRRPGGVGRRRAAHPVHQQVLGGRETHRAQCRCASSQRQRGLQP